MSREPGEAPGLDWKKRPKDGVRIPRWRARKKAVALGYRPSVIQLDIDPMTMLRLRSGAEPNGQIWKPGSLMSGRRRYSTAHPREPD
jgi:hypothetical protein